ncbi:MAG TPA: tetratricopeptide repeat protein [bacterium]|nr:tetratricopeptide repeat protein [bacterium]
MSITPLRVGSRGESDRRDASSSERVLSRLISTFEASSDPSSLRELRALARERDPELLGEGLLSLAGRMESRNEDAKAQLIYEAILELFPPFEKGTQGPALPDRAANSQNLRSLTPEGISRRAQERLALHQGSGSFGARFEMHARHFFHQASDPAMIAGMGAAGLVSNGLRLGVLSRLAARPASWMTRGFGARFGAGAASLAFEAPAFTAAVHGANAVLGRPQDMSQGGLGHELASGYLLLGALRLSGGAHRAFAQRFAAGGSLSPAQSFGMGLLEQGGTFGAILASQRAEQALGLRPASSGDAMAVDALATLLQFRVGSRFADAAFGPRYQGLMREMRARSDAVGAGLAPARATSGDSAAWAPARGAATPAFAGPQLPNVLMMSSSRPPPKGAATLIPEPLSNEPSRVALRPPIPSVSEVQTIPTAAEALRQLREAAPKAQARRLKEIYQAGQLAALGLEVEQLARSSANAAEFAAARRRLQDLEAEFDLYYQAELGKTPVEQRWRRFQEWQNQLYPSDPAGLARVHRIARAMGLPDLFTFKAEAIKLKARVQNNQEAADYFHDLSLVRNFLRERGLNRAVESNPDGQLLSNLLLRGDGNCVTLSMLFAHFAGRIGRHLEIGLLPRHTFLVAKHGGAIDSILDFGTVLSKPYLARAIGPEMKALPAQHLLTLHLLNLGKRGVNEGDFGPAESTLSLARGLLPENPRPYLQLGSLHQRRGEVELAFQNYARVHALHPTDMHFYNNLRFRAWERLAVGQYREAEEALKQMNELRADDVDVLRGLKLIYERTNRRREAAEMQDFIEAME